MEQKEAKNFQNLWKAWILGLKKQNESYTNKWKDHGETAEIKDKEYF